MDIFAHYALYTAAGSALLGCLFTGMLLAGIPGLWLSERVLGSDTSPEETTERRQLAAVLVFSLCCIAGALAGAWTGVRLAGYIV